MNDSLHGGGLDERSVMRANVDFHAALAKSYDAEQPHFRPENKALVAARLRRYAREHGHELLVDFGCGTGFVISLAVPYFDRIVGVDITPAMTDLVDRSSGKVEIWTRSTHDTGMPDDCANLVSANSFLHHLYEVRPTLAEAFRILKPGGLFFAEEDPNFAFWDAVKRVDHTDSPLLRRELAAVNETATQIEGSTGVPSATVAAAEFQKMVRGGFRADELSATLEEIGFRSVLVEYYWFLGQASVLHGESPGAADTVERYLRSVLPFSAHLFKYLRIEAVK